MGREHKMQVANGDFLNETTSLREFRLAARCWWLTSEHPALPETAGTAKTDGNPVRPDDRGHGTLLLSTQRQRKRVRFSFDLNSKL